MKKIKFILGGVVCVSLLGLALAMDLKPSVDQMEVKNAEALASAGNEYACDGQTSARCKIKANVGKIKGKGGTKITTPGAASER